MCVCVCARAGQVLNTTITLYGGSVYGTDTGLDADLATMPIGPAQLGPRPARRSRACGPAAPLDSAGAAGPAGHGGPGHGQALLKGLGGGEGGGHTAREYKQRSSRGHEARE